MHGRISLTRFSLSASTCSSLSFPSTSSTPSCTLSSTTRSSWKACATPPTRGVTTPTTSPPPSQELQLEEYALKLDASDFACRSKAKAKPQRREPAGSSTRTILVGNRTWTDVEPGEYSLSDFHISKKLIHLLRHGKTTSRK